MNTYSYFFIGVALAFKLIAVPCLADCPPVDDIIYVYKEDDWSIFQTADGWYQPVPGGASLFIYAQMYAGRPQRSAAEIGKVKKLYSVVVKPDRVHCLYWTEDHSEVILEKKGDAIIKNLENWHRNSFTRKYYGCDAWGNLDCFFDFQ